MTVGMLLIKQYIYNTYKKNRQTKAKRSPLKQNKKKGAGCYGNKGNM